LVLHDEPIYCDNKIIGRTTSGNYSFNYKKNMVLGYVNLFSSKEELQKKNFVIEIEQKYYKTNLQKKALHDPNNIMLKK
jgi:4-methylaminobutanoate oxidase (formaldehyde-forming)